MKAGAFEPTASRFGFDGGLAAEAGSPSSLPTPGSTFGWKPTLSAAATSAAGAFWSAADVAAGGGAFGEERVASRIPTATPATITSPAVPNTIAR